jgi:hypothetical protein
VLWPGTEPIGFETNCIGITAGGTEAVDLGRLLIMARPQSWDGLTRRAMSEGGDGSFTLDYRIAFGEGTGRGHPIWLDPSMTVPTNVRTEDRRYTLRWDYAPRADEEPIDGFRIYLNDTLQWIEDADARRSGLPPEWFTPPCGEEYRFTVTAFRDGFPDGPESAHSIPAIAYSGESGDRRCEREVIVRFEVLSTRQLQGDGRRDPGDVGPVYGSFYVNDEVVEFDGRCSGSGFCDRFALRHNSEYDINTITSYYGSGMAALVVGVPPGEDLVVGFDIWDADTGRNNADDHVCGDWRPIYNDDLDSNYHSELETMDRSCKVTFSVEPIFGSPVIDPGEEPPLPLLAVTDLSVDEATGRMRIHLTNNGAGTWPEHDLEMALTWRDETEIGTYTIEDFFLAPGDEVILEHPEIVPEPFPPLSACVNLDPNNIVPEEDDRSLGWTRGRFCRDLPDLVITDVSYQPGRDQLLITIQNIGEASIDHRNVSVSLAPLGGPEFAPPFEWEDLNLAPRGIQVLAMGLIDDDFRDRYIDQPHTYRIDSDNSIAEESEDNNSYEVPGSAQLQVMWRSGYFHYYYGGTNRAQQYFDVYRVTGESQAHNLASWTSPEVTTTRRTVGGDDYCYYTPEYDYQRWYFDIAGDEDLKITIAAAVDIVGRPDYLLGRSEHIYSGDENWGARDWQYQDCDTEGFPENGGVHGFWVQPTDAGFPSRVTEHPWTSSYTICRLTD